MKFFTQFTFHILTIIYYITFTKSKTVGVVEFIRHGSRSPSEMPKNGPKYFFDAGEMILTVNGFYQEEKLGRWIGSKYIGKNKLLPEKFNQDNFSVYCSAKERTIFSAVGLFQGLYPGHILKPKLIGDYIKELSFDQNPPIPGYIDGEDKLELMITNEQDPVFHAWKCNLNGTELKSYLEGEDFSEYKNLDLDIMMDNFKGKIDFLLPDKVYNKL